MNAELSSSLPNPALSAVPKPGSLREPAIECPGCRHGIPLTRGLCGQRQVDAVLLQSSRLGSELECLQCGQRFIFHRPDPLMASRLHTPRAAFSSS